jgi:hypothetical protein
METLADKLLDLRNYLHRYGNIVDDASCEIAGHHDRITTYAIEGKKITVGMHDGDVSSIIYR